MFGVCCFGVRGWCEESLYVDVCLVSSAVFLFLPCIECGCVGFNVTHLYVHTACTLLYVVSPGCTAFAAVFICPRFTSSSFSCCIGFSRRFSFGSLCIVFHLCVSPSLTFCHAILFYSPFPLTSVPYCTSIDSLSVPSYQASIYTYIPRPHYVVELLCILLVLALHLNSTT